MKKTKKFLICVDSDGCVMNTMDMKHIRCFGPCLVAQWGMEKWETDILELWNQINLYSITRGINRFLALKIILIEIDRRFQSIPGIREYCIWADQTSELSNRSLKKALENGEEQVCLSKALSWSEAVNRAVNRMPDGDKLPFPGAKEALLNAKRYADIVVISSANKEAVLNEWRRCGLDSCVDFIMTQEDGSKASCIGKLMELGYKKEQILMVGDTNGDMDAAKQNGVFYYPILRKKEKDSWVQFEKAVDALIGGKYGGGYQKRKIQEFEENLINQ